MSLISAREKLQEYRSISVHDWKQPHDYILEADIRDVKVCVEFDSRKSKYSITMSYPRPVIRYCRKTLPSINVASTQRLDTEIARRLLAEENVKAYLEEVDQAEDYIAYQEAEAMAQKEVDKNLSQLQHVYNRHTAIDVGSYQRLAKLTEFFLRHKEEVEEIFKLD